MAALAENARRLRIESGAKLRYLACDASGACATVEYIEAVAAHPASTNLPGAVVRRTLFIAPLVLAGLAVACGGGGGVPAPNQVAGIYVVVRSYVSNTCVPEIPGALATVTGTVAHVPGASQFTLSNSDGGNFGAQVQGDGSFTSGVRRQIGVNGESYDLLFEGRFSLQGFRATVAVDLFRAAGTCRAVVDWVGTKQGPPNVLP